ncbi:3-methylmercaptopropionyl-CoA ligase [Usitatibacter rugosus]|uniref:3-methylmercaptopropionyl-CoA ligase n=1 Tax=Usitatibacter rugosus TaxID=2732067 RepID=A0A6M4GU05_9PROT|nr:acyl-CoA synthetase [Usitatibacter rugosus]QJR10790.1 3-methylmercaptopropionyl-CoA ligase [Usitatibacter rugosus]
MVGAYESGLERNPANYAPLTPVSFLAKAAAVFPERVAIIHGPLRRTWAQVYSRSRQLASALAKRGIRHGDTVAAMLPNIPAMIELHFGPAMFGAVLNTLNTRLDAEAIAFMLDHGEAKVLFTDREFSPVVAKALALAKVKPLVVDVDDALFTGGELLGSLEYEALLAEGDPGFEWQAPPDEWDAITLNYTSGTTGNPKGVVYHYRGAYLNALSNIVDWSMPHHAVYLWTLPMFHCNGWCFNWTLAAIAGTSVCLRRVEAKAILDLIRDHRVTHYCGAPIVHSMLVNAPAEMKRGIVHEVAALVAAAAPPAAMIEGMATMGFRLTHVYGLTETYGPASVCAKHPEWTKLPIEEQVRLNGRQGVAYLLQEGMDILDPHTMQPVPRDGETMGEIMFRGNITMKGYLKNPAASAEAFRGGWFHTGDLGVMHPDGYAKIKDRSKDVIISGGENISSQEVEDVLHSHPAVMMAAVVAQPDAKWGETPCAFIELKEGASASVEGIIEFCRSRMARFKVPKTVVFGALPKTSTGKIQKFILRERAKSTQAIE